MGSAELHPSPLEAEIEQAMDMVNGLKCQRDKFSNYIAEHQAFLAPMHCLPVELL